MGKVLVSPLLPGRAIERLRAEHDVTGGDAPQGLGERAIAEMIAPFDALLTTVTDRVGKDTLALAPRLRVVANCGVGYDNIDVAACRARGIVVTNTPGALTDAVADLTFALILDACRRVTQGDRLIRAGRWEGFGLTHFLGMRVTGAALGLIGLGRIGRAVAERARGFRMKILYTAPRRAPVSVELDLDATHVPLDALLADCDIVAVTCRLDESTRGLLSRERIARMKRGAILVSTSRGACVDERAVAEAIQSGHLAGAGLDVYADEPRVDPALLACDEAVLAPHIGSADRPTREAMANLAVDAVLDVLAGRPPKHAVQP